MSSRQTQTNDATTDRRPIDDLSRDPRGITWSPARDVLTAHAGKQHAYRHALALQRLGRLARFATSGYYRPGRWPDRLASHWPAAHRSLLRRNLPELDELRVDRSWSLEAPEIALRGLMGNHRWVDRLVCSRDARFDDWIARTIAARFPVYWGFQGSCLASLKAARAAGRLAVAEFATAHITLARALLGAEADLHPEWAATISNLDYPAWYLERLEREPHEADYCVAASSFTRRSLEAAGVPAQRIALLPLGADVDMFQPVDRGLGGPLRVLFVGGVGQRKGIKYLLQAAQRINSPSIRFRIVGPLPADPTPLKPYRHLVEIAGRMDQTAVVREMQAADVLVLPSVFEGFGLVIPEAMATGMPVIASTHTIGPEMITDGQDGFLMAPNDVDLLVERLEWMAGHRQDVREMGRAAHQRAQAFSWAAHQSQLGELLRQWTERTRSS